jgi:hypothetical protein
MPYWFMGLILWFSSGAHSFRMRGRRPRTIAVSLDVRIGSKAPFRPSASHFRSTPINGRHQTGPVGPVGAIRDIAFT